MFAARLCPIVILLLGGILTSSTQAEEPTYLPNVGPSNSTYVCQTAVHDDYMGTSENGSSIDPPLVIDPYAPPPDDPAFEGVQLVTLMPGVVT